MRQPQLRKTPKGSRTRVSSTTSKPAPVGGLNARDSIANMSDKDALIMKNWWPTTNDVMVREGWAEHVTDFDSQVESLMVYTAPSGSEKLFAAEGTDFFDVSSSGSVGSAVVSSLTNARWDSVNFTNSSAVSYLCCFNGVDNPQYYNGSTWIQITGASTPAITGVTTSTLKAPWVHKRRMWVIQDDALKAWYLPVDAVGGAANALDVSGICQLGGSLVAGGTWTMDAGDGPDDYFLLITSEGEVVVYAGTDPSSSSTWALVGVWRIGEPIGRRPLYKYRGDMLVICTDGVYPMSKAMQSSQTNRTVAVTDKIREIMANSAAVYKGNYGWQLSFYPEQNMLILNIPVSEGSNQVQYAMNTITGSWGGPFVGMDANCWAIYQGQPYFGGNTYVGKFWGTNSDNGSNIDADLLPAFSYFGNRGTMKSWKLIRPIFLSDGTPNVSVNLNVDYQREEPNSSLTFAPSDVAMWDSAVWDSALWGGSASINQDWSTVYGVGNCAALRMRSASKGIETRLEAVDYVFENGGIVG